jgi:ATP phosphoribosyltransferase
MKAAGLKAIDTVVQSTAVLIKSKNTKNELVDLIASRIRGVIGMFCQPMFCFLLYMSLLTVPLRCAKICPVPIQHSPRKARIRLENHTWQARSYYHRPRASRMGCC